MTTLTDSDLRELKAFIKEEIQGLRQEIRDVDKKVSYLDKKVVEEIQALRQEINNVDKKVVEVLGKIETCNAKIEALDKQITTKEFIYRAVFISIIGFLATSLMAVVGTSIVRGI